MNSRGIERNGRHLVTLDRIIILLILALQVVTMIQFHIYRKERNHVAAVIQSPAASKPPRQAAGTGPTILHTVSQPHNIHTHVNRMFMDALNEFERMERWISLDDGWASLVASPAMDMREFEDSYVVLLGLPAGTRDNLKITLDGRLLTVFRPGLHAEAPHVFERRIWLPGPVDGGEDATATLTNNMLKVVLPKAAAGYDNRTPLRVF